VLLRKLYDINSFIINFFKVVGQIFVALNVQTYLLSEREKWSGSGFYLNAREPLHYGDER
jgi:hypothetical protein